MTDQAEPRKMTPEQLQEAVAQALEQPMADLCDRLTAEFDKELRSYIAIFEAGADLRPDKPEAPGLRAAAQIIRKAMESDKGQAVTEPLTEDELSHLYAWLQEGLPHCRCGSPDESDALVVGVLELIANNRPHAEVTELIGGPTATWQIVLGAIEHAGLISHGSSCHANWITERGDWVRAAYHRLPADEEEFDYAGFPHDGRGCPPDCELGQLSEDSAPRKQPDAS